MKTSRDNNGKLRIAKSDKTGLGGQYAPDTQKLDAASNKMQQLNETVGHNYGKPVDKKSLSKMGAIGLAEIMAEAEKVKDVVVKGQAMSAAERKGIWEETLGYYMAIRKTGDPLGKI